jgi:hypothetical protein
MAKVAAEKARQTSELATAIALKWQRKLKNRQSKTDEVKGSS